MSKIAASPLPRGDVCLLKETSADSSALSCVYRNFQAPNRDTGPPMRQHLLQKGGVPAAPSGTATLLRLSPNHQFRLGPVCPVFRHGLTGGVYKARERIHRAMADARLLANPASRSRVPDSDPN